MTYLVQGLTWLVLPRWNQCFSYGHSGLPCLIRGMTFDCLCLYRIHRMRVRTLHAEYSRVEIGCQYQLYSRSCRFSKRIHRIPDIPCGV